MDTHTKTQWMNSNFTNIPITYLWINVTSFLFKCSVGFEIWTLVFFWASFDLQLEVKWKTTNCLESEFMQYFVKITSISCALFTKLLMSFAYTIKAKWFISSTILSKVAIKVILTFQLLSSTASFFHFRFAFWDAPSSYLIKRVNISGAISSF